MRMCSAPGHSSWKARPSRLRVGRYYQRAADHDFCGQMLLIVQLEANMFGVLPKHKTEDPQELEGNLAETLC